MKKILFILLLTIPFLVNGQGWQQTYGDSLAIDIGYSAQQTKPQTNIPFIKIYDDGTVEKRIIIE